MFILSPHNHSFLLFLSLSYCVGKEENLENKKNSYSAFYLSSFLQFSLYLSSNGSLPRLSFTKYCIVKKSISHVIGYSTLPSFQSIKCIALELISEWSLVTFKLIKFLVFGSQKKSFLSSSMTASSQMLQALVDNWIQIERDEGWGKRLSNGNW